MSKKATMKQIADKLDLSVNAVSLALKGNQGISDKTRLKVLKVADEIGYLDQERKYNSIYADSCVCVMINKKYHSSNFYSKILYGIEKKSKIEGYHIILFYFEINGIIPECITSRKVTGVIIMGSIEEEYLERIYNENKTIILVDHSSYKTPCDCVLTDNRIGAYKSVTKLIDLGYRKIGFFGDFSYSVSNKERFWGYLEAMQKLEKRFDLLFENSSKYSILEEVEKFIRDRDTKAIADIVKNHGNLPEVFQCSNDRAAMMLYNAFKILDIRIPEDIGIVGFDDSEISSALYPSLATVHISNQEMGIKAFERLVWRRENSDSPHEKILMETSLVDGDSIK